MSKDRAGLRVEVKVREKPPNPFKWEIYRGDEPMWIERAMHGYSTERDAYDAGEAVLARLLSHEALNKRWATSTAKAPATSAKPGPKRKVIT
jgi:hypothetical protein